MIDLTNRKKLPLRIEFRVLLIYIILEYGRPQDYFPALGVLEPGMIVGILLFVSWLRKGDRSTLNETPVKMFILFIITGIITFPFVVNHYWAVKTLQSLLIFLLGFTLPAIMILNSKERFDRFFNLWIVIHLFISIMCILNNGVGPGSFLGDENDLALALNMAIPYAFFMSQSNSITKKRKIMLVFTTLALIMAVTATFSRGGFVGLVTTFLCILIFSKNKIRNLVSLTFLTVLIVLVTPQPTLNKYFSDMETMTDEKDNTREERIHSWIMGWRMFLEHPILGVGIGNYPWNVERIELQSKDVDPTTIRLLGGRAAHSLYFTLIPEMGLVGIILYIIIIINLFKRLFYIFRLDNVYGQENDLLHDYSLYARAIFVSLFALLSCGAFISVLYYPHLWYIIGFVVAVEKLTRSAMSRHIRAGE